MHNGEWYERTIPALKLSDCGGGGAVILRWLATIPVLLTCGSPLFPLAGLDIRRLVVSHLAGRGRLDVHRQHTEPVRHLVRPVRGSYATRHLSEHHVHHQSQIVDCGHLGAVLCHLFSAVGRLEGSHGM